MEEQDKRSVCIVCPYKDGVVYSHDQVLQAIESVGINRKAIQAYDQMEKNRIWEVLFVDTRSRDVLAQQALLFIGGNEAKVFPTVGDVAAIRVFWAPLCVPTEFIANAIQEETQQRGGSIRFLNAGFLNDRNGMATSNRFFKAEVENRDQVPHLIDVHIPTRGRTYRVLVMVQGRDPMCLKCKQVGHHRASCTHSMSDSRWCRICDRNSGHATVDCPDYTDYSALAQRSDAMNMDEDPSSRINLQPPVDSTSSVSTSTTIATSTSEASTLVSASSSTTSSSTISTSSSTSTQSFMASTLAVPVSNATLASPVIAVPKVSTVTTSSAGVCSFPSASGVDTSTQGPSTKAITSSEEMDTLSQDPSVKEGGKRKKGRGKKAKQKKMAIYESHHLWTMQGKPPPQVPRNDVYEADAPGDDEFSLDG